MITIPLRVTEKALSRVVMGEGGCHVSTYSVASHGYAQIGWLDEGGKMRGSTAPRAAMAPIPDGMTVDHTCRNRRCVNRDHMRFVTLEENGRDAARFRWDIRKTPHGGARA